MKTEKEIKKAIRKLEAILKQRDKLKISRAICKFYNTGFTEFIELESLRWVLGEDEKEEHNHE